MEKVGGRNHWRIDGQSPKFSHSNLRNINIRILLVGHSPMFSPPRQLNSPMFSPANVFRYTVIENNSRIMQKISE